MKIADNTVVALQYILRLDDKFGEEIERVKIDEPLVYIQSTGVMLESFEKELEGKQKGDLFSFTIKSENAYGAPLEEAIIEVDEDFFKVDGKVDKSIMKKGNVLELQDENGTPIHGEITEIKAGNIKIDINHPLAGEDLYFDGKVLDVREATAEELEKGDVEIF